MGIEETKDQDKIKNAYLHLVKRYHPDSGTEEANEDKFREVNNIKGLFFILVMYSQYRTSELLLINRKLLIAYFKSILG